MSKFKRVMILMLCIIMAFMTGCSSSKSANKNDSSNKNYIIDILTGDPGTADVQLTTADYAIPLNIFDRLVEVVTVSPGESDLVPGLAESWDVSEDGKVYTFYLKQGVKFHNGEELKADDVLFTFDRMLNPETKALNTDFLDMIDGADERMEGTADNVRGIKVIDDYTVEITLSQPYAPFLANLATPAGSIYNRKNVEEAGDKFGLDPQYTIGTGPFKLVEWVVNDKVRLEAYDDYFKGRAKLDGVIWKITPDAETQRMLFETGEVDVFNCDNARSQIPYFEKSEKWKDHIVSGPRVGLYYYAINENIKPFDDIRVRKALQMAIDRKTILEKIYHGKGSVVHGIMPPGLIGNNPNLEELSYDPEKAKELLAEAGYPNGFDMVIAQVTDSPNSLKVNELVQAMLGDIGINVKIEQMDSASFYGTRKEGELPMYLSDWSADFNDPDNFIYTFFEPKNSLVRSFNYYDDEVASKLEQARGMTDQEERMKLYQELEMKIVHEDAAWIPLFMLDHLFVVNPRVKNFQVPWNGWSDHSYYDIYIEE